MKRRVKLNLGWAESEDEFDQVEVGDRLIARRLNLEFPGVDQPRLLMTVDSSSGVPRCVRLELVSSEGGREVRTGDLRGVEIEAWIDAIVPLFMDEITTRGEDGSVEAVVRVADTDSAYYREARSVLRSAKRASRRKVGPELLRRVAETYLAEKERPAEAVELAFDVSPRTAYRYIALAREAHPDLFKTED